MDYRYETKKEAREFHKKRVAFIIYNDEVTFIKNSELSHWEYCEKKGFTKQEFNKITRGYFLNDSIVFYKNNFIYDTDVINEGLKYIDVIMKECNARKVKVYFGLKIEPSADIWPYEYYYGVINKK